LGTAKTLNKRPNGGKTGVQLGECCHRGEEKEGGVLGELLGPGERPFSGALVGIAVRRKGKLKRGMG